MLTYFEIIPKDIIVTVLSNFKVDKCVHSLIDILKDKTIYRKICLMVLPDMVIYPEEIQVEGIHILSEPVGFLGTCFF